mgnify:CR=1 FL=1
MTETKPLSRSEREAKIKDKAGFVISVFALLLAFNTYIANGLSGTILTNTIKANDTYSFYQSKSIKQSLAEQNLYEAQHNGDKARAKEMEEKIERYENEPKDGKVALLAKAKALDAERDDDAPTRCRLLRSDRAVARGRHQPSLHPHRG